MTTPKDPADYWEERLQPFDLGAVGHLGLGLPYVRWLYRLRSVTFRRLVRTVSCDWKGARVLDVGSGTGFYVNEWRRMQAAVMGSDITKVAVDKLSQSFPGTPFVRFDVSEIPPFPAGSFEAISAVDMLFHIVDDARYEAALQNIASLLKDGGFFFFSEFFLHSETTRADYEVDRSSEFVESALEKAGLELVLRRPMFVLMSTPVDSKSRLLNSFWSRLAGGLSDFPKLGGVVGASLYPLERTLLSLCREGPSTEFAVCRKSS